MTYNNPQHSTTKYSCTPFPILKEGDTSEGIVTYLDLVSLGSIAGFGVDLTQIGGTQRWDNTSITAWQTFFEAIDAHLKVFDAKLKLLEQGANPDSIIITPNTSQRQLTANADVTWSSSNSNIVVNPTSGTTTTYSLASSATAYGSFTLRTDKSSYNVGDTVTFTVQWTSNTKRYDSVITASKTGMTSATANVTLYKDATRPSSVALSNGKTITLNNDGYGTITVSVIQAGSYTVTTQGNETAGSCSFNVIDNTPVVTTTYYWYAGTILPTASNIASISLGSSTAVEQWNGKEFNITNSGSSATPAYVCTPVDFKVSWKDTNGFTVNLVEVDGAGFTANNVTYKVQKRGRDLASGATFTVKGYYTA